MTPKTTEAKKTHRSADDRVAELEQKIAGIKARAAAKEAKARPEAQPLILAVRALDKAARVAVEAGNKEMAAAVDSSRAALAPAIVALGIRLPDAKAKRGRKRKTEAA